MLLVVALAELHPGRGQSRPHARARERRVHVPGGALAVGHGVRDRAVPERAGAARPHARIRRAQLRPHHDVPRGILLEPREKRRPRRQPRREHYLGAWYHVQRRRILRLELEPDDGVIILGADDARGCEPGVEGDARTRCRREPVRRVGRRRLGEHEVHAVRGGEHERGVECEIAPPAHRDLAGRRDVRGVEQRRVLGATLVVRQNGLGGVPGADRDEDRLEPVGEEPLEGVGRVDATLASDLDAELLDRRALGANRGRGHASGEQRAREDAARLRCPLEDHGAMPEERQVVGARQPGGAAAHDRDAATTTRRPRGFLHRAVRQRRHRACVVRARARLGRREEARNRERGGEPLERPDGHRGAELAPAARGFAGRVAAVAAGAGKRIGRAGDQERSRVIPGLKRA